MLINKRKQTNVFLFIITSMIFGTENHKFMCLIYNERVTVLKSKQLDKRTKYFLIFFLFNNNCLFDVKHYTVNRTCN